MLYVMAITDLLFSGTECKTSDKMYVLGKQRHIYIIISHKL